MAQRITNGILEAKVKIINEALGTVTPAWNVIGTVRLYGAYGSTAVHRVMNTSGGVESISPLGTKREVAMFLDGMISALRITEVI